MGIVFIIALVLVWPTAGLSLLAIPVFAMVRGYLRGIARKTKDNYLVAERNATEAIRQGKVSAPTWIRNTVFQTQLIDEAGKAAAEAGMTPLQAQRWLSQPEVADYLMTVAGCFEKEGFGRLGQIVGACDFLKRLAREQLEREGAQEMPVHVASQPVAKVAESDAVASYAIGRRLFESGMALAAQYKCQEAIDYYTRSIEVCKNPAPYINRANLLGKRIRHHEAMQDLQEAHRLDREQGNEFSAPIARELKRAHALTQNYRNGVRETLIQIYENGDHRDIAEAALQTSFGISPSAWKYDNYDYGLVEFHFFNEIDNIVKFEEMTRYPEAEGWVQAYPNEFILMKVDSCPDIEAYRKAETKLHIHLCSYEQKDMQRLRRIMLYAIHRKLMIRDFGGFWDSLDSECRGVTKEADEFQGNTSSA